MAGPRVTEPVLQAPDGHATGNGSRPKDVDPDAVRAQLEQILASAVLRNSRRNSQLLRHVVERVLAGRAEDLKERSIGIDVFGRPANYDTNTDHIVRSVAGEVRRRLAQYYMEPGHEAELRIDLQAGSYLPHFRWPAEKLTSSIAVAPPEAEPLPPPEKPAPASRRHGVRGLALLIPAALLAVAVLALVFTGRVFGPKTALERFWGPVFSTDSPIMLCVGGGGAAPAEPNDTMTVGEFDRQPSHRMHTSDALALAALTGLMQSSGKPYKMLNRASGTSFKDLQSGPFVLIGGLNNEWTMRLTGTLRFGFERTGSAARISDKQNPANTAWGFDFSAPLAQLNRDYAIISRVRDPKTEQTAVVVAGIGSWGTLAAGEFVSSPEHLKKLDAFAPRHWERNNVQVVIATDVIRGSCGPPVVLAVHFW